MKCVLSIDDAIVENDTKYAIIMLLKLDTGVVSNQPTVTNGITGLSD